MLETCVISHFSFYLPDIILLSIHPILTSSTFLVAQSAASKLSRVES